MRSESSTHEVRRFAWNLPTFLTLLRITAVPVLAWLLLDFDGLGSHLMATAVFVAASLTDLADGALARKYNQITSFGVLLDPIADKLLTGTALICLSIIGQLPWWVTAIIVIRELAVTALRLFVVRTEVIAASPGGKAKTVLQIVAISAYLIGLGSQPGWWILAALLMAAALVATVATGIDYFVRVLRTSRRAP
jgi:CDP-diacylglycerol--glycerol-3-phosphate 3-phosphatidyltransferase